MGIILSTSDDFWTTQVVMNADAEIKFRFDLLRMIQAAQSWGAAQEKAQNQMLGISYGGGGSGGGPNVWGYQYGFWKSINYAMFGLGLLFILIGGIGLGVGMFIQFPVGIMFALMWVFLTFLSHHFVFNTNFGQSQLMYSTLPMWCILGGGVVGAVLTFGVYGSFLDGEDSELNSIVGGAILGTVALIALAIVGMKLSSSGAPQRPKVAPVQSPQVAA